jgi:VanZ family protein
MSIKHMAKVCSVAALVLLALVALGPAKLVPRSGLGWRIDHFVGYFGFTLMFCLAWPRPLVVGGAIMTLAVLLEGLQTFTPDRHPDFQAALISAGGAMAAVLPADLFIRSPRRLNGRTLLMLQRLSWPSRSPQLPASLRLRPGAPRSLATVRALSNSEIAPGTLRRRV